MIRQHRALTLPLAAVAACAMVAAGVTAPARAAAPASARHARPAPPTDVTVPSLAYDAHDITLRWEKPADHAGIVDYHVYLDGHYLGSAQHDNTSAAKQRIDAFYADPSNAGQVRTVEDNFTATGLRPDTTYHFTVRSVDAAGHESADSRVVTQRTAPTPKVFDVRDYGAVGDGRTLDTTAIQAAIDACTPGGEVLIPAGVFVSGSLWLKSDMTLKVAQGGTLRGSANAADYAYGDPFYDYETNLRYYALINARNNDYAHPLHDIRIVGPGSIDGNGWKQDGTDSEGFPVSAPSSKTTVQENGILAKSQVNAATAIGNLNPYGARSNLIMLRGVRGVYYGNFTALNPAQHTIVNLHDQNVTVNDVKITTYDVNNADGIEFNQSDGLTVMNNVFDTGDDAMNFAAGLGAAAEGTEPAQNAWIANNYFRHGHGAVVAGSHTGAWIENVTAEDNVINGTDIGLRMKTNPTNGGGARNFLFRDNAMKDIAKQAFVFTSAYSDPNAAITVEPARSKAHFTDITVEDVTVDGTKDDSIEVLGTEDAPDTELHFTNVHFLSAKPASIEYLRDSTFDHVVFDDTADPWAISHSSGLRFGDGTTTTAVTADAATGPRWPHRARLTASADATSARLSWPAAGDDTAVSDYQILRDGAVVAIAPGGAHGYLVTGLAPDLRYHFTVRAEDATGNQSSALHARVQTSGSRDTVAPTVPEGPDAVSVVDGSVGFTWAEVSWQPAADNYGVAGYQVYANGRRVATVPAGTTRYTLTGLSPSTTYRVQIRAVDDTGNATAYPTTASATTWPPYDSAAPSWPRHSKITAYVLSPTSVRLSWTPATDDIGVTGYRVYVDGRPAGQTTTWTPVNTAATTGGTSYTVTGLTPGEVHTFRVEAGDAATKWSNSGPRTTVWPHRHRAH